VRTGALRQTAHLCRTAAGDDDGYDQIPLVNGARPDGMGLTANCKASPALWRGPPAVFRARHYQWPNEKIRDGSGCG